MKAKDWFGILYVSIAIIIWGTIGSIIDYPLLIKNIYSAGSLGQGITFSLTGIFTVILSVFLFKKVESKFIN